MIWLWGGVLLVSIWAAHWGAEHFAQPLKKLRRQWGLTGAAGGALIALATASPELGVNITSAIKGVSGIGLGAALGANLVALPLTITVAYGAFRTQARDDGKADSGSSRAIDQDVPDSSPPQGRLLPIEEGAVTIQALPYLAILGLVALLTLPSAWRGLQPIDGWILLVAYALFLFQALTRGRGEGSEVQWSAKEIGFAVAGIAVLAVGAYFTVIASNNILSTLGISKLVGGLFITGTLSALPEVFSTWSVTRSGEFTAATTTVIADQATTMTLAFLPLALVSVPLQNVMLYWVSLAFLAVLAATYGALIQWGSKDQGFTTWKVTALDGVYLVYLVVVLVVVLNVL